MSEKTIRKHVSKAAKRILRYEADSPARVFLARKEGGGVGGGGRGLRGVALVGRYRGAVRRNRGAGRIGRSREKVASRAELALGSLIGVAVLTLRILEPYLKLIGRCATCAMGMMGMFKWLRKDIIQRERNGFNMPPKQFGLNNESYRSALQAFIDRRRLSDDAESETIPSDSPGKYTCELLSKTSNEKRDNTWKSQECNSVVPGVPHIRASEIFEIGWVAGTDDRYLELIFAEWQNTRVSLKRHTHPECRDAVKADLEVLTEIRHPMVLLLMGTTQTDDYGLVSIFESIDCTLYNYVHEQGERIPIQGIAKCAGKLADALRHAHMRGYVHSAISPHCVFLASSGTVKLGGWELAVGAKYQKPEREYEERLRAEIFRWLAPEIFYGIEPRKETDVYGLTLLIWEMCTMHVPWSGFSRPDIERQYVQWKRGVILDLYNFPPLLNNLLEAGLQLDVTRRTLDMNRMRRFLQRLEMQYEDQEPIYVDQYANNNNESGKTYIVPLARSPQAPSSRNKGTRLSKSMSAKQLSQYTKDTESPIKQQHRLNLKQLPAKHNGHSRNLAQADRLDLLDVADYARSFAVEDALKRTNMFFNAQNDHSRISCKETEDDQSNVAKEEDNTSNASRPWNYTYRKVKPPMEVEGTESAFASVESTSTRPFESDEEESFISARDNIRRLKEMMAHKREHFFYGSDSSSRTNAQDNSPRTKSRILSQVKSKDYEPHKPASHKTSLEPKCNKSPGQYDPSYAKLPSNQLRKVPYLHTPESIKDAIIQPQVLNSDPQGFFESSLWRREKLICISKMRKEEKNEEPATLPAENTNDSGNTIDTQDQRPQLGSPQSNETYVINSTDKGRDETNEGQETILTCDESTQYLSPPRQPLQSLKDALDRATEIVRSGTPNTDESYPSSPFKTYETFDLTEGNEEPKALFEDLYKLRLKNEDEEIRSIERSIKDGHTFFVSGNVFKCDNETEKEEELAPSSMTMSHARTFVCESIAEASNESISHNDTRNETSVLEEIERQRAECGQKKGPAERNFALLFLNDGSKSKDCKSCHQSALPRRRSLPAALSQLRTMNNSALGKLPIRRGDIPDSTVEDLYIDDEFGDSLNVNMVLLHEDLSLDEDFLSEISEL
ncbi:hypothetical protein KM043_014590 [Ampulex compressa]|nr:hypothetical protein KM043_014590 [Ampulex compressa]